MKSEMAVLRRIGVFSLAKLQAVLMAIFGLIAGIFYAIIGSIFLASSNSLGSNSLGFGAGLGLLAIIVLPVVYAVIGFIAGAIGAFLYNLVARWTGGIEMDFSE